MFAPAQFPRQPVRAIVIRRNARDDGFEVGALQPATIRSGAVWLEGPIAVGLIAGAWEAARAIRQRTGLPILDRTMVPPAPRSAPTGGLAA